ncbi:MAG: SDR family NAD(P)-dependent oxidoreductase [Selenomonadaceae bacterium]|nr:SDR family NAD(P)-dependent oxidoreductase [Selenomonadaceae bacterium]MBR1857872.1 SDR family NAD(P)-dependent oxidoreductase [Selenomonadaceae bacterium]
MSKLVVVVGAGKGMGNHIAERFAQEGFKVVLMARRQTALDEYVAEFAAKGYEAYSKVVDVADTNSLTTALNEIQTDFGVVDVLVYNAALMQGGKLTEMSSDELMKHYQIDVASALHCVHQVLPKQIEQHSGALLFTGGLFGVHPNENLDYAGISIGKTALRSMTLMLNTELKDKGIYSGIVQIMGVVGSNEHLSPKNIAEAYWKLYKTQNNFEYIYN